MPHLRRRSVLLALVTLSVGSGLASAAWDRLDAADLAAGWDERDGREVLPAADVARQARDEHPLRSEDGWTIRRVAVRVNRAALVPDHYTEAVQVEGDLEITFRVPSRYRAVPGTTLVVWACLRERDGRRLVLGQVCPE